jgi:sugar phosphate isomerase/epimerase
MSLAIAPLSVFAVSPADYIAGAASAGFTTVGLRVIGITPNEPVVRAASEVRLVLEDTGVRVLDIEVLSIGADTTRDDWLPALEIGAELGARYINVVGEDPDAGSFAASVARLAEDSRDFGIVPVLEAVAFRPFNSYPMAIALARELGCLVEADALHFQRTGASLDDIRANSELFAILQLCDAPAVATLDPLTEARAHRLLPGDGDIPLRELITALPEGVPVSVEIPNDELLARHGVDGYFALLYARAMDFLSAAPPR